MNDDVLSRLKAALADRYAIEREIGSGGMATVYLARDVRHDRDVAIKVLRPDLAAILGPDRFLQEIKIAAQLQHPNILPLHDSGEVDGSLYYVMPYVEGQSLREKLAKEGELPVGEAVRILRDIVDALTEAHAHGVVHRDIKPENILLRGRHALVTDFGVAKAVSEATGREKLTTAGVALGTPAYMAPEQASADPHLDQRVDIYAVGAVAYELLTGRAVFLGTTPQMVLSAHMTEPPQPPSKYRESIPAALESVVLRCLEKRPADRWQSADELLPQLESLTTPSGGVTPTDTRPITAAPSRRTGKRRSRIAVIAASVVVVGGLGVGWIAGIGRGGSDEIERIAVLPIEDISGQDDLFVDAMHDALTNALSRIGAVGVASRSTMMAYRDETRPTRQIAAELELDAVIEMTVFRAGDVMRINVQFVDPVTTRSHWSDTYERDVSNILDAQSDIVARIAAGVGSVLGIADPENEGDSG
jgi:serine/threonine-protein kinase